MISRRLQQRSIPHIVAIIAQVLEIKSTTTILAEGSHLEASAKDRIRLSIQHSLKGCEMMMVLFYSAASSLRKSTLVHPAPPMFYNTSELDYSALVRSCMLRSLVHE